MNVTRPDRPIEREVEGMDNEQIIRNAYKIAENKDNEGWLAAFTPDGTFTDESIGVTYRGRDRVVPLENFGRRSPTCTASSTGSTSTAI